MKGAAAAAAAVLAAEAAAAVAAEPLEGARPPMAPPNFRAKGSAHRVMVKGLPMSASWQDLKVWPALTHILLASAAPCQP